MRESVDAWLARIGSKDAMEKRQANPPRRKPAWGLARCAQEIARRAGKRTLIHAEPVEPRPVTVIHSKSQEPKKKRKSKWTSQRGRSTN